MISTSIVSQRGFAAVRALLANRSGVAMVEFAYAMPIFVVCAGGGLEVANYAKAVRQVSDIASTVADNASRLGSQAVQTNKPVTEADVNDVLLGGTLQGSTIEIATKGRIILSSLERGSTGGASPTFYQYIHWQRCKGSFAYASTKGVQGTGAPGGASIPGVTIEGSVLTATDTSPVMIVEVAYRYKPITPLSGIAEKTIVSHAAFTVRASRDTSQLYNSAGVTPSTCS